MNRLAQSHSPYLLQHKNNPVDWQPWDDTALATAKRQGKPIFLSVGYAACHWCHVMEHESFEDESIAATLNANFVCIKVDREERPDVDKVYMNAVQMMTGHGGWPMSVFMTPELQPFYTGTYWPHPSRGGMPGFAQVLEAIIHAWTERRDQVLSHADEITTALCELATGPTVDSAATVPDVQAIETACERLLSVADTRLGGFAAAPKFPHATDLDLLLRRYHSDQDPRKLRVVTCSLDAMANGGIFDHIGGGFARYSVDAHWLVPHFEKMLYDNALLARLYSDAFQATGNPRYAEVARQTLDYLLREMQEPDGGIHSSEDADSEGIEGKYYVWTPAEVIAVLGDNRGPQFCAIYDITLHGNFEEQNIPRLKQSIAEFAEKNGMDGERLQSELRADIEMLRRARDKRIHPARDDKVLMGWNALAIEALATAGAVLNEQQYVTAAETAAQFVWEKMTQPSGRFYHAYRRGHAHLDAFQDDLADYTNACLAVFRAAGNFQWIERAEKVAMQMIDHYADGDGGGFFYTANDAELVIARQKDWHDSSIRSGNGAAAMALLDLAALTGNFLYAESAKKTLVAGSDVILKQSAAAAQLLAALDRFHRADQQIVIAVNDLADSGDVRNAYYSRYRPHTTLSWVTGQQPQDNSLTALNAGKGLVNGEPALYVCQNYHCRAPIIGTENIVAALRL